jgi:glycosyltransferase involved in cell wall biosynthesis
LKTETKSQSSDVSSRASCSFDKVGTEGIGEARSDALFSLIVCTRGRTEELNRLLLSVINQSGDIRYEIIVVDQNTDGRLDPIIAAYRDRASIEHIHSSTGLSRGRNFGLRYVRGSVVAFPDDDCVYPENLLNDVNARLASLPTADGVSVMSKDFKGKASGPRWSPKEGWITKNNVFRQAISYGLFFRAGLVRQVGVFDESLGIGSESSWQSGEETDYVLRALAQGLRIFYIPSLFCLHAGGNRDESDFRKQVNYAAGGGRLVRLHSFSWVFRARFFAAPFLRAMFTLLRLAPRHSKWQLDIGLARWRGFFSGPLGRVYPFPRQSVSGFQERLEP